MGGCDPLFHIQVPELIPPNSQQPESEDSKDGDSGCDCCCTTRQRLSYRVQQRGRNNPSGGLEMTAIDDDKEEPRKRRVSSAELASSTV